MARPKRTLEQVLRGMSDANVRFSDLCNLLIALRFEERVKGDHFIFAREGVEEIINIQPRGSLAKPYQVKQMRSIIQRYGLGDSL